MKLLKIVEAIIKLADLAKTLFTKKATSVKDIPVQDATIVQSEVQKPT